MNVMVTSIARQRLPSCAALLLSFYAVSASAQDVTIIQPGAPGEPSRQLTAEEAIDIAQTGYSPADVTFMQDMIPHHNQAVQMSALVADRTNRPELVDVAGRIDASQADEIEFMQQWLETRGEKVPDPSAHAGMHTSHTMAGMASPEEMEQLAASTSTDFDRLFLQLMIAHHAGAVTMVEELLLQPGSAYDTVLFEFTNDITNDQTAEIERMNALLVSLSDDPRAGLSAGLYDAGTASLNMQLLASLQKPPGFVDVGNPAQLSATKLLDTEDEEGVSDDDARSSFLSFANTDMAFADDVLVAGSYHGFNVYKLANDGVPQLYGSIVCPGGQGDVSIVGDLLIMSVQQTSSRVDCGLGGINEDVSSDRFRGIRIFDISDLAHPVQVGQVQTCRGSHTHSVVSGPGKSGKIVVYNSGTSSIRDEEELPGCIDEDPGDSRTALFRIDVIEIPVDDPSKSRIVDSPAVFADPETGILAGLWKGGDHGEDTQETFVTDQCHDITVFPEAGIAGGACSGNGILFDIRNPLKPKRIDAVVDKGFAYWHSATFNNDGTKVVFTDEWGGGSRARCRAHDPLDWGADAIYDIVEGKLEFRSYFKMPAPQVEQENCVAHNGSIIPVPGRDILVQAWYQGGISIIDFTDSENPVEIAYFDRGPIHEKHLTLGGYWSAYWYNGRIYGTEIVRGLDVFSLLPSDYLSENELAAAALADQGRVFNPQQQFRVTWPAAPVVAKAYVDQMQREKRLSSSLLAEVSALVDEAATQLQGNARDKKLARRLRSMANTVQDEDTVTTGRQSGLPDTLNGMAALLR